MVVSGMMLSYPCARLYLGALWSGGCKALGSRSLLYLALYLRVRGRHNFVITNFISDIYNAWGFGEFRNF